MVKNQRSNTVLKHYEDELVKREIARFSAGRWVAIHCQTLDKKGRPYLLRYLRQKKMKTPLTIDRPEAITRLMERFKKLKPRTFYASINVYKKLSAAEDTRNLENIAYCLPTWDIDNKIEKWEATVEVAREILKFLRLHGVKDSVFLKWSGNGMHIHIHNRAFSEGILERIHPLDIAYSVVEYVNMKLHGKYLEIAAKHSARNLRVENKIDIQRVFTCPLSLHRSLDVVAICIDPNMLDDFSISWVSLGNFKHWEGWNRYIEGEADSLAIKACETVGGYPLRRTPRMKAKKKIGVDELIMKWIKKSNSA